MSIHLINKSKDKRFVDVVVTIELNWFSDGRTNNVAEFIVEKNYQRQTAGNPKCKYFIHTDIACYAESDTRLKSYLQSVINIVLNNDFKSVAFQSSVYNFFKTTVSEFTQTLASLLPDDILVYVIADDDFTSNPHYEIIEKYIQFMYIEEPPQPPMSWMLDEKDEPLNWWEHPKLDDDSDDDYLSDVISILKRNSGGGGGSSGGGSGSGYYSTNLETIETEPATEEETNDDTHQSGQTEKQSSETKKDRLQLAKSLPLDKYIYIKTETFSEMLFRLIDEKGIDEVECYKRANINRRTFSKIRTDENYHPSKRTVFAFAIALELDYNKAEKLLNSAGYTFSCSSKLDMIVEYFIFNKIYNIYEINETLFAFGQQTLG